jgi:flagellar biosynthesis/type III secretory pathway chaperone
MEAERLLTDELCLNLTRTLELLSTLSSVSVDKEAYLTSGDVEKLRAATEKEEELLADLGKLEKDRDNCAGALSKVIGIFDKNAPLSSLIERLTDPEIKKKLTGLRKSLNEAVIKLTERNGKLSQLLSLQISYTEYMLNLIYIPKTKGRSYGIQGARQDVSNDLSLFDVHV